MLLFCRYSWVPKRANAKHILACAMNSAGTLFLASSPRICSRGSQPPTHPVSSPAPTPAPPSCTCNNDSQWPRTSTDVDLSHAFTSSWQGRSTTHRAACGNTGKATELGQGSRVWLVKGSALPYTMMLAEKKRLILPRQQDGGRSVWSCVESCTDTRQLVHVYDVLPVSGECWTRVF